MKKIFVIAMTVLVVMMAVVGAGAEELVTEDITEAAETSTETQEETAEEVTTEPETDAETSHEEADTELNALLEGATPEQIENIKQYIIYGISALPLPDQVRAFASEYLDAIAWLLAGTMFLLFFIGNRMTKKSLSDAMATNNNNMVEAYDDAKKIVENATKSAAETAEQVKMALQIAEEKCQKIMEESRENSEKYTESMTKAVNDVLNEAKTTSDVIMKAFNELLDRESGMTEAEVMMAKVLCDLVSNSSLPETKKDEFTAHLLEGISKIKEVSGHDEA